MESSERIDEPRNRSLLLDDLDSGGNPSSCFRNGRFEGFYNLMFVVRVLISCFCFFILDATCAVVPLPVLSSWS